MKMKWNRINKMLLAILTAFVLCVFPACDDASDLLENLEELSKVKIKGEVKNDKGQGVDGATIKIFKLSENTDFVEGGDITSSEAKIKTEKVAASNNSSASGTSGADGSYEIPDVTINAFMATAGKEGCSLDIQGFDDETGILNLDTLLMPDVTSGSTDITVNFVITCADPPAADDLSDDGSNKDAEPVDPPQPDPPACDQTACEAAGGTCENDTCKIPACATDADCVVASGQEGSYCVEPGTDNAECMPPDPNEIIAPEEPQGWNAFKLLDSEGGELLDASAASEAAYTLDVLDNSVVRVYGEYEGDATTAFVMVQTGSQKCEGFEPKIDYVEVPIVDGKLAGGKGDFVEVYIYGGFMKIQLSTSNTNGDGDRSMPVEVGEECELPENPLTVILSWNIAAEDRADIDLHVWNKDEEQCYYARKSTDWGMLDIDDRQGPGPEVFTATDATAGPFVVKARYFSGGMSIDCKVRVIRFSQSEGFSDTSYSFTLASPRDVFDVGLFSVD